MGRNEDTLWPFKRIHYSVKLASFHCNCNSVGTQEVTNFKPLLLRDFRCRTIFIMGFVYFFGVTITCHSRFVGFFLNLFFCILTCPTLDLVCVFVYQSLYYLLLLAFDLYFKATIK